MAVQDQASTVFPPENSSAEGPLSNPVTATPPSRQIALDQYAQQIVRRAEALDLRSRNLQTVEQDLAQLHTKYQNRQRQLDQLETTMRREMKSFLDDIAARQRRLSTMEQHQSNSRSMLREHATTVRGLISDVKSVSTSLQQKKNELRHVTQHLLALQDDVQQSENTLNSLNQQMRQHESEAALIGNEKEKLQTAAKKLERLEKNIQMRDKDLSERERILKHREQRAEQLMHFEAIAVPLRHFLQEYDFQHHRDSATARPVQTVEDRFDSVAAVQRATIILKELANKSNILDKLQVKLDASIAAVQHREKKTSEMEASLRARAAEVDIKARSLEVAQRDLHVLQERIDVMMRNAEHSRAECDTRENGLREREVEILGKERSISRTEANLEQMQKATAQREKSVRRAHTAVTAREKALNEHQKYVKDLQQSLQTIQQTINLKEDMIEARELELSAREAETKTATASIQRSPAYDEQSVRQESHVEYQTNANVPRLSLQRQEKEIQTDGAESFPSDRIKTTTKSASVMQTTDSSQPNQQTQDKLEGVALTERGPLNGEKAPTRDDASTDIGIREPRTVRRHLAFDSSVPQGTNMRRLTSTGVQETPLEYRKENQDDESEAAADELLPELFAARSLWRERVVRLKAVVESMQENTRAIRPHLQPVLRSVADVLQRMLSEVDTVPSEHTEASKSRFAEEQRAQIRWSEVLRQQLDSVRDIQAGMLIAFNREEDITFAQGSEEQGTEKRRRSGSFVHTGTNVDDGSSVDITLDATAADGFIDILEDTEDMDTLTSSFRKFRMNMQNRNRLGGAIEDSQEIAENTDSQRLSRVEENSRSGAGPVPHNGANMLQELASLRADLESLTTQRRNS